MDAELKLDSKYATMDISMGIKYKIYCEIEFFIQRKQAIFS